MSISWSSEDVGLDGDKIYGRISVDHWLSREGFEFELDADIAVMRDLMLLEHRRLLTMRTRRDEELS